MPYFLGVDPGLGSMGLAVVRSDRNLMEMHVLRTQKGTTKKNLSDAEDTLRRVRDLRTALLELDEKFNFSGLSMESFSPPRSSSASAKYAMSIGVLVGIFGGRPILQASPQEIKIRCGGKRSASKEEVRVGLQREYPGLSKALVGITASQQNHAVDALGAIVTCMASDQLRMALVLGGS